MLAALASPSVSATDSPVRFESDHDGAACRITLDRPDKLNALNDGIRKGLQRAIAELAERDDMRVVVLAGAGQAFSAGADLTERIARPSGALEQRRRSGRWQRLLDDFERLPQVTIAQLHGHVIGGAALLAAACDLRVGADNVSIAIPEVSIGIPLTWAGLPRLVREVGLPRTREMVLTGRRLPADEALAWGFLHRVLERHRLDDAVDDLVAELVAQPTTALAISVDALRALGRATSASDLSWSDPDVLRWSLRDAQSDNRE
jgi:enoyl-CoA hydratase/carnithine racemase